MSFVKYEEVRDISESKDNIEPRSNVPTLRMFHGRRVMVSKFWWQEIGRRWRQRKQEPPHARTFTEPKCQARAETWYLFYRWIIFLLWGCFVIFSFFEIGSYEPLLMYDKWLIYLTNWDVLLGFAQALIGVILVLKRWRLQKVAEFDPCDLKLQFTERLYWFLYVVATNIAIGVTVCYWFAVYNPKIHRLDPLNIMLHVCNSVLMLLDLFVTSVPFRLTNFWWCLSIAAFYVIFTVIYYVAGGLDKHGNRYIYEILDWKKPVRTALVCAGGLTFVTIIHCIVCVLAYTRDRLYRKIAQNFRALGATMANDREKPLPRKRPEVV